MKTPMEKFLLLDSPEEKRVISPNYNHFFNKNSGFSLTYSDKPENNPEYAIFGPTIADCEISAVISEEEAKLHANNENVIITNGRCSAPGCANGLCYKKNDSGNYLAHTSLKGFKKFLDKMAIAEKDGKKFYSIDQIAFGVISPLEIHPEIFDIFKETRQRGIICNLTINQRVTPEIAEKLSQHCGAVAVSVNPINKEMAYNSIKMLSQDYGMKQCNFHVVLGLQTLQFAKQVVSDVKTDQRLSKLNAVVFLSYKNKTGSCAFTPITIEAYKELVKYCEQQGVNFGFDSCSAFNYLKSIKDRPNYEQLSECVESCCGCVESSYFSVFLKYNPCSFLEGDVPEFGDGIDVLSANSFTEIWNSKVVKDFRQYNLSCKKNQKNPCKYNFL